MTTLFNPFLGKGDLRLFVRRLNHVLATVRLPRPGVSIWRNSIMSKSHTAESRTKAIDIRYTAHCRLKDLITVFLTSHLLSFTWTLCWSWNKDPIDSLSNQFGHSELCLFALLNRHRVPSCNLNRLVVFATRSIRASGRMYLRQQNEKYYNEQQHTGGAATKPYSSPSSNLSTQPCPYPIANPACNLSVPR